MQIGLCSLWRRSSNVTSLILLCRELWKKAQFSIIVLHLYPKNGIVQTAKEFNDLLIARYSFNISNVLFELNHFTQNTERICLWGISVSSGQNTHQKIAFRQDVPLWPNCQTGITLLVVVFNGQLYITRFSNSVLLGSYFHAIPIVDWMKVITT